MNKAVISAQPSAGSHCWEPANPRTQEATSSDCASETSYPQNVLNPKKKHFARGFVFNDTFSRFHRVQWRRACSTGQLRHILHQGGGLGIRRINALRTSRLASDPPTSIRCHTFPHCHSRSLSSLVTVEARSVLSFAPGRIDEASINALSIDGRAALATRIARRAPLRRKHHFSPLHGPRKRGKKCVPECSVIHVYGVTERFISLSGESCALLSAYLSFGKCSLFLYFCSSFRLWCVTTKINVRSLFLALFRIEASIAFGMLAYQLLFFSS